MSAVEQPAGGAGRMPWIILSAATVILAVASGGRFLMGLVFDQVRDDFAISHGSLGLVVSMSVLIIGLSQPLVGWLVDRISARVVAGGGLTLLAAGLIVVSRADSYWVLAVAYGGLVALGLASISPTMITPLVTGWFDRNRSTALSIASAGNPAGQSLIVPVLALMVGGLGWRNAYAFLGLGLLVLGAPLMFWLLRDRGAERDVAGASIGCSVREAVATRQYWQLAIGFFACGFTMSWVMTFFVDFTLMQGMSRGIAATALSIMGWMSIAGALGTGWWADRTGNAMPLAVVYALRGVGFAILMLTGGTWGLLIAMVVIGISWSATTPLTSSLCANLYGRRSLGAIFGLLFAIMPIGSAVGSASIGFLYDMTGSYTVSLIINIVAGFVAAVVIIPLQMTPVEPKLAARQPDPQAAAMD